MPLYEFQCIQCRKTFEELVRALSAVDEVVCPRCGSRNVKRKVSVFASRGSASGPGASSSSSCAPTGG